MRIVAEIAAAIVIAILMLLGPAAQAGESPAEFNLAQSRTPAARMLLGALGYPRRSQATIVDEAAGRLGVPVAIARAVMRIESGGDCRARSRAGAVGVMQVMPATARAMGVYGDLRRCEVSIEAGLRYLRRIITANGTGCAALSLYERGEAARPVCTRYGRSVMALARSK